MEIQRKKKGIVRKVRDMKLAPIKLNLMKIKRKFRNRRLDFTSPDISTSFFSKRCKMNLKAKRKERVRSNDSGKRRVFSQNPRTVRKAPLYESKVRNRSDDLQDNTEGWNQTQITMFNKLQDKVQKAKASRFKGFVSPRVLKELLFEKRGINSTRLQIDEKKVDKISILKDKERSKYSEAFGTTRLDNRVNKNLLNIMPKLDVKII